LCKKTQKVHEVQKTLQATQPPKSRLWNMTRNNVRFFLQNYCNIGWKNCWC